MPRVTNAPASRRRRKRRLNLAKGFRGARSKLYRQATEAVDRAMRLATIHRRQKKRDFRRLWITRIGAAAKLNGLSYSEFIGGLDRRGVALNRKMLADIAVKDERAFSVLAEIAKEEAVKG